MKNKQNMTLGLFVLLFLVTLSFCGETSAKTERCVEITPGVYKCMDSDGNTRTLIVM